MRRMVLTTKQGVDLNKAHVADTGTRSMQPHRTRSKNKDPQQVKDSAALNADLESLINSNRVELAEEMLLNTLNDFRIGLNRKVRPDCFHFAIVIKGWGRSGVPNSAERAEKLLYKMISLCNKNGGKSGCGWLKPNKVVYSSVVNCWAMSRSRGSALRAEELLKQMENITGVKPNFVTYSTVIKAWAKEGHAEKAEELLVRMEELFENGDEQVKPNTVTYNLVIEAFAKSNQEGSARQAEKILKRMNDSYKNGNNDVKPDVKSYSNVIDAWAASNEMDAPQRAEELLRKIEVLFLRGDKQMKPSVVTYGTVIKAWTRNNNPLRAEAILKRMEKAMVQPNSVCFYMVIAAWARSADKGSTQKVEALLKRMKDIQQAGHQGNAAFNPDVKIYNAVIDTWTNCCEPGAPAKAEETLQFMLDSCASGNSFMEPNLGKYIFRK